MFQHTCSLLEQIIAPFNVDIFLREYWPKKHLLIDDSLDRFRNIPRFPAIRELADILEIYRGPVMVVGEPAIEASEGIVDRFLVSPETAKDWYLQGAALEFDYTDIYLPGMRRWLAQFKAELGLPQGTLAKVIVYAAANGGGFPPHFDAYTNFVFQVKGRKTWRICPNQNVIDPVQHYELAAAPYLPEELAQYWTGEHPQIGLPEAETLELQPGSLLYLPRGYWHTTESNEETLAINITLGQPTWLDLFLAELKAKLVAKAPWRELASNFEQIPPEFQSRSKEHLTGLLRELAQEIEEITPAKILARHTNEFDPYQRTQFIFRQMLR